MKPGFNTRPRLEIDEDNRLGHGHEAGEPYVERQETRPTQLKAIASPYADLSPTELLARLRASLERIKS